MKWNQLISGKIALNQKEKKTYPLSRKYDICHPPRRYSPNQKRNGLKPFLCRL
ncbi:hypothetical protein [Bacillus sp. YC2]|uniref:hypothetical protein n=1 Tax=Bacillus sp. YC2 TaxID=2861287 RepID=UPI00223B6EFC|nr:hypothetical protein [Bacillus sp. YC2]